MISRISSFLLRHRNAALLTRSRVLCNPAIASRIPGATNARVSTQDMRTWHLAVVSIGLLGTVLLSLLTSIFSFSDVLDARLMHASSWTPPVPRYINIRGQNCTVIVICLLAYKAVPIHLQIETLHELTDASPNDRLRMLSSIRFILI